MTMQKSTLASVALAAVALVVLAGVLPKHARSAEETTVAELAKKTHFHGIAVDPGDPTRIYLATHHGFFLVSPDGRATRASENGDDFMGFTPHPRDRAILYASGHPAGGGNLGIIVSRDGGRSWQPLAKGVNGPVDFHQMDVSKADPNIIYGVHDGLQVSRDGGRSWTVVAPAPDGLIDLAASAKEADTVFAATRGGLLVSKDGGRSWRSAHMLRRPASMVETTASGDVFAFILGTGLVRAAEPALGWQIVNGGFGEDYVLHLAVDPANASNLHTVTYRRGLVSSRDGGATWTALGAR